MRGNPAESCKRTEQNVQAINGRRLMRILHFHCVQSERTLMYTEAKLTGTCAVSPIELPNHQFRVTIGVSCKEIKHSYTVHRESQGEGGLIRTHAAFICHMPHQSGVQWSNETRKEEWK